METVKKQYRLFPNFGDSFGTGWDVMMDSFLRLFLLVIILVIVDTPMRTSHFNFNLCDLHHFRHWNAMDLLSLGTLGMLGAFFVFLGLLYSFLVAPVFRYGGRLMFVQSVRQEKADFECLIKGFRENYLSVILANLLVTALVVLGLFALIVPGIIIGCRLAFVGYLVMDKKLDPIEAVETSWRMTRGHGWTIFFMGFTSVFIFLFGILLLLIGIFPALIWIGSSFASLYESILRQNEKPAEPLVVQN
ncbi:MAG: hypothetical protein ABR974_02845 [Bacteroidales bacterium]|jgi:uncharacterized membrane protein